MEPTDVTIEILKDIRDSVRATNDRIGHLSDRVDGLAGRVDQMSDRIVESEPRTATAVVDLRGTVVDLTTLLRSQFDLRPRVDRCEKDISEIKERLHLA